MSTVPPGTSALDRILRERGNSTVATVRHFGYVHLEEPAAAIGRIFHDTAVQVVDQLPDCAALKFALEHLLIARNAAIDAAISAPDLLS